MNERYLDPPDHLVSCRWCGREINLDADEGLALPDVPEFATEYICDKCAESYRNGNKNEKDNE